MPNTNIYTIMKRLTEEYNQDPDRYLPTKEMNEFHQRMMKDWVPSEDFYSMEDDELFEDTLRGELAPFYGKKHTEETKRKMRSKKRSEEHKRKISEANKGRTFSEESKRKMSESRTGKKMSEQTKKLWSIQRSGEGNNMFGRNGEDHPAYGYKHTEEHKKHMSKLKSGKNHHLYGKTHTEETKRKMRRKVKCPHCDMVSNVSNMKRYHFDKCKHKT